MQKIKSHYQYNFDLKYLLKFYILSVSLMKIIFAKIFTKRSFNISERIYVQKMQVITQEKTFKIWFKKSRMLFFSKFITLPTPQSFKCWFYSLNFELLTQMKVQVLGILNLYSIFYLDFGVLQMPCRQFCCVFKATNRFPMSWKLL